MIKWSFTIHKSVNTIYIECHGYPNQINTITLLGMFAKEVVLTNSNQNLSSQFFVLRNVEGFVCCSFNLRGKSFKFSVLEAIFSIFLFTFFPTVI